MAESSNYKPGDMPVEGHHKTYGGFMAGTIWGGGLIIIICLYAILTFAAGFAWLPSLIGTVIVGVLYGLALKMKTNWYAAVMGMAVLGAIVSIIITLAH